jgi:hypothetical protein
MGGVIASEVKQSAEIARLLTVFVMIAFFLLFDMRNNLRKSRELPEKIKLNECRRLLNWIQTLNHRLQTIDLYGKVWCLKTVVCN